MAGYEYFVITPDVKIGKNVKLGAFVHLTGCEIGDECQIGPHVVIQRGARIGRNVRICSHVFIGAGTVVENDAYIGPGARLTNDRYPNTLNDNFMAPSSNRPIKIGSRAYIGPNSVILGGVSIGDGVIVNAGSLVSESVQRCRFVSGIPATVIRHIPEPLDVYLGKE